ncbi:DUF736 domain-containing protein [Sphingopyxis sp. BSN-002]|uniref:DUF6386 family protein n=1 Tax=Sphingopyxis sp. BSN-002 TaxID=2911495 RepID=UPI001EDB77EA|nr:DUF6386 family protein [Sphingopyxis sp. BSN-002]UKK83879.1 DUF736 domain-containing protein [Sphingopyxis sp. BSN-002]
MFDWLKSKKALTANAAPANDTRGVFDIVTDTATICVFDLAAMSHRKDDTGDWWSIPRDELMEVRNSNALFLNLGADGRYQIEITKQCDPERAGYHLKAPSGRIFIGAGEEMSGGGFEPTGEWGGAFLSVDDPHQKVSVSRQGSMITINFQPTEPFLNDLVDLIRI